MSAAGGGIVSINRADNPGERIFASQQDHTAKQCHDQRQCQSGFHRSTPDSRRPFFMSFLVTRTPHSHGCTQKEDFCYKAKNAAARFCHYKGNRHETGGEDINEFLFLLNCARENQSERQGERQFHVAGKMVAIDKWTKRLTLRQFAHPIDLVRTCERLSQSKDCQKKTEDSDCPHEQPQTFRRVSKNKHGGKKNFEGRDLNENEPGRVGIKRETAHERDGMGAHVLRMAQWQKLKHSQQKHPEQG